MASGRGRAWSFGLLAAAAVALVAWWLLRASPTPAPAAAEASPVRVEPFDPATTPYRAPPPDPSVAGAGDRVRGDVVDPSGAPVAGARVRVFAVPARPGTAGSPVPPAAKPLAEGTTGDDGTFIVPLAAPGTVRIVASAAGFAPGMAGAVGGEGAAAPPVRIILIPGRPLTVRVLDAGRRPVPGIPVAVLAVSAQVPRAPALDSRETGPDGSARFPGLPAGVLAAIAYPPDGRPVVRTFWFDRLDTVDLLIGGRAILAVTVVDGDGAPVPEATVGAFVDGPGGTRLDGTTGPDGRIAWEGLAPGRLIQLTAEAPGFAAAQARAARHAALVEDRTLDVTVELAPGASIAGTVRTADGEAVPGALVELHVEARFPLADVPTVATDTAGAFRFADVAPGKVVLRSTAPTAPGEDAFARLEMGDDDREADLVLRPRVAVTGRALDPAGRPVGGAAVAIGPAATDAADRAARGAASHYTLPAEVSSVAVSDAEGRWIVPDAPPGDDRVAAGATAGWPGARSAPFDLPADGGDDHEVVITLAAGVHVEGTVADPTGEPIAGATVLVRTDAPSPSDPEAGWTAVTDAGGAYHLAGVRAVPARVRVEAAGFAPWSARDVPLVEGSTTRLDAVLQPALALEGIVVDAAGTPVTNARVFAGPVADQPGGTQEAERAVPTEADGSFRIDGLAPGSWTLRAEGSGFGPADGGIVAAGTAGLRLELPEERTIGGVVLDPGGGPVTGAWVTAHPEGPRTAFAPGSGGHRPRAVRSDDTGRFLVRGAADGTYRVEARKDPAFDPAVAEAVRAGDDDLRLVLRPRPIITLRVVDGNGEPYEGRTLVRLFDGDAMIPATQTRWKRGRWTLTGMPFGRFRLRVTALDEAGLVGETEVRTGDTGVEVVLGH